MEALHSIIKNHTSVSYSGLWTAFTTTDVRTDGKVWDMYSSCNFTFGQDQDTGSGGTAECQYYNREHSFPKSWFGGDILPMYTDLFHLYPTDKKVNSVRANYPFGKVGTTSYTSTNGSKLGNSNYSGYSGTVFEPIDEYKGDFARTYFYMATRYYDIIKNWSCEITNGTQYPAYKDWVINLLLEWHENDAVSTKEINRNNIIYQNFQYNRNPFIDNPDFAKRIWGSQTSAGEVNRIAPEIRVFPNPAQNSISISNSLSGSYEVKIYSAVGQMLKSFSSISSTETVEFSISDLPNGVYLINVLGDDYSITTRILVAK
jgi:endonuclease I